MAATSCRRTREPEARSSEFESNCFPRDGLCFTGVQILDAAGNLLIPCSLGSFVDRGVEIGCGLRPSVEVSTTKPGKSSLSLPRPYNTHEPIEGRPEMVVPVFMSVCAGS